MRSKARHNVVAAGRRSFKTERAKKKLVLGTEHWNGALTTTNGNFFYGAPTYGQAKRIAWKDLKLMTEPFWAGRPNESELVIRLITGSEIHVFGLDKPERIEGTLWHGGVLDEFANMKESVWGEHIQAVTADTGAWIDVIGVPEGRNHYYELAERAKNDTTGLWAFFTWHSADVINPIEIENARASLDEETFNQEYCAEFLKAGRTVYKSFSDESILHGKEFEPTLPTVLCFDFNATEKPFCVTVVQDFGEYWCTTKEFAHKNTQTETMCGIIDDWLSSIGFSGSLMVCGDSSGQSIRTTSSRSDYAIIRQFFSNYLGFQIKKRHVKAIRDRVNSVNALLRSADGSRRLYISSLCPKTIEDFSKTEWKENGVELNGTNPLRTHLSDTQSYFAHNFFPLERGTITSRMC